MNWAHSLQAVLLAFIAVGAIPLIRRRRNRLRRGVLPPPSTLCRRGFDEHIVIDQRHTSRSIP